MDLFLGSVFFCTDQLSIPNKYHVYLIIRALYYVLIFNRAGLPFGCSFSELPWSFLDIYPSIFILDRATKIIIEILIGLGLIMN